MRCPKNASGLRCSLHFSTAAEKVLPLHPPPAAQQRFSNDLLQRPLLQTLHRQNEKRRTRRLFRFGCGGKDLNQRPPGYELRLFLFTTSHDLRKSLNLCGFPGFDFSWPFTVFDDLAHTCAPNVRQKTCLFAPSRKRAARRKQRSCEFYDHQAHAYRPTPTAISPPVQLNKKQALATL